MNCPGNINSTAELRRYLRHTLLNGGLPPGSRLPGVRSLGRECGIHYQTVSRIYHELARQGLVEIRHGIGAVVKPMEFSRVRLASLIEKSSDLERSHMFYRNEFQLGADARAEELGVQLDHLEINLSMDSGWRKHLEAIIHQYDGLVLDVYSMELAMSFRNCGIPVIYYIDRMDCFSNAIFYDRIQAVRSAVHYLAGLGVRRIGLISNDLRRSSSQEKFTGYVRGMREAGLSVEPDFVWELEGKTCFFIVAQQMNEYLKRYSLLDGYICTGSNQGSILLSCLQRDGIPVPERTAVVGYDEIEGGENMTRIILPRRKMARRCIEWLLENIGQTPDGMVEVLPPELHLGQTTQKLEV